MSSSHLPPANQAQIIRANQRDLFHVASFREQVEVVLRAFFGTRRLLRWDKEIELCAKLAYFGLTTRYASQTLGEEYTDIWQHPSGSPKYPSRKVRWALTLFSTLPPYLISRVIPRLNEYAPGSWLETLFRHLPAAWDTVSEINLAMFYFQGVYYDFAKRLFRMRHMSTIPPNPSVTPPSYSLLGVMLAIRLAYRSIMAIRSLLSINTPVNTSRHGKQPVSHTSSGEPAIDAQPLSYILASGSVDDRDSVRAEEDEHTLLDVSALSPEDRASRRCTLCLEERTSTCATECGHLFCWSCIFAWGKEKSECPLCRQSVNLTRLLPIYNM